MSKYIPQNGYKKIDQFFYKVNNNNVTVYLGNPSCSEHEYILTIDRFYLNNLIAVFKRALKE